MLWLGPEALTSLPKPAKKPAPVDYYVSGILAQGKISGISPAWKTSVHTVYPFELGDKRRSNQANLESWLKNWRIPLVDEEFQTEVFFNLLFLTDLTSQMLDNLYRDYLVERAEDMLSVGSNITAYPRLSLAAGQRFASKGAYIAKFAADGKLQPESDWIVP
jgi:hypothetical protein